MKVLITGATGLVGSALVSELRQAGIHVHYLTTRKEKIRDEVDYKGFHWDPEQNAIDLNCFEGVSVIVNLAGANIASRWTPSYRKKIQQSRTDSLQTLKNGLSGKVSHQVEYLLSASAIGIYPSSLTDFYTEETRAVDPGFLGETVVKWEQGAKEFSGIGIPQGIMRIGLVLAGQGGALPEMARPIRLGVGSPLGSGQQWQSWIHIRDLARMIRFCLEERLEGVFNAVAPNPVTNQKLTREIAAVLGRPLWLPKVPAWALRMVLGEMSRLLLASQRVSSEKIEAEGFEFEFKNVHRALEDLLS
ncbi:MAG: TIGR01777 family oxidoreductase [Robiginitalea sp.]